MRKCWIVTYHWQTGKITKEFFDNFKIAYCMSTTFAKMGASVNMKYADPRKEMSC